MNKRIDLDGPWESQIDPTLGSDATQIARIALQAPFRVAIHASRLLQAGG